MTKCPAEASSLGAVLERGWSRDPRHSGTESAGQSHLLEDTQAPKVFVLGKPGGGGKHQMTKGIWRPGREESIFSIP